MSKIKCVPFYYVRHGQTDWNLENRAMGQRDIPLNEKGINQALVSRNLLLGRGIKTICYSPLLRARMTAEIFGEMLNCELIPIHDLQEFNLGRYSGQIIGSWFDDWRSGKDLAGEEEPYEKFQERCTRGINQALALPGPVLIVAHGGVYWTLEDALQVHLPEDLPNCVPAFHLPPQNGQEKWKISLIR